MEVNEVKQAFVTAWGSFGTAWGITRTVAQVHALLLVNNRALCTDDIMDQLHISRGNASASLNQLVQWGLIQRVALPGERRDYYQAEKDPRKIASIIVRERKKRELEPLLTFLNSVAPLEEANENEDARHLNKLTREMRSLVHLADAAMEKYIKADASWLEKLLTFAVS